MRKVLLGEEKLEIGYWPEISHEEIQTRMNAGEEVIAFDQLSIPDVSASMLPYKTDGTASSYLDKHTEDFAIQRREKRAISAKEPRKIIRAGTEAEIHLRRPVNKEQEQQLRLIAKLITTILEEK